MKSFGGLCINRSPGDGICLVYPHGDIVELTVGRVSKRATALFVETMDGGKRPRRSYKDVKRIDIAVDESIELPGHYDTGETVVTLHQVEGGRAVFRVLAHNLIRVFRSELLRTEDGKFNVFDKRNEGLNNDE